MIEFSSNRFLEGQNEQDIVDVEDLKEGELDEIFTSQDDKYKPPVRLYPHNTLKELERISPVTTACLITANSLLRELHFNSHREDSKAYLIGGLGLYAAAHEYGDVRSLCREHTDVDLIVPARALELYLQLSSKIDIHQVGDTIYRMKLPLAEIAPSASERLIKKVPTVQIDLFEYTPDLERGVGTLPLGSRSNIEFKIQEPYTPGTLEGYEGVSEIYGLRLPFQLEPLIKMKELDKRQKGKFDIAEIHTQLQS